MLRIVIIYQTRDAEGVLGEYKVTTAIGESVVRIWKKVYM